MNVTANSAIATLTVATGELNGDPLLQLVTKVASPLQLTVKTSKKASLALELKDGMKLTQRNSIIRCLCGMGLHNALDGSPYYLLGGHASPASASPNRATSLASLTAWMSLADQVKKGGDTEGLLDQIDSHLETRAFLIDSPSLTIADVDLAVALVRSKAAAHLVEAIPSYSNVHRWIAGIQETMLLEFDIALLPKSTIPEITNSSGPPVFFYGNETNVVIPKATVPKGASGGKPVGGKQQQQKQQNESNDKSKKEAKAGKQTTGKQQQQQAAAAATFDVSALDIRVGKIVKAWHHPESEKLFCEEIDLGEEAPRQIASGLRAFYKTEELEGRRVVVLCNLKSRKLVGFPSHGMVLCASNADHTAVECMEPPEDAAIGERILFEGYTEGEPEVENKIAKKKIFEKLAPDLKTDANGVCFWKGAASKPSIKASKGMPDAHVS
jgi:aminoacyl tRNA synthase complex-interacting multifunctional protein 1